MNQKDVIEFNLTYRTQQLKCLRHPTQTITYLQIKPEIQCICNQCNITNAISIEKCEQLLSDTFGQIQNENERIKQELKYELDNLDLLLKQTAIYLKNIRKYSNISLSNKLKNHWIFQLMIEQKMISSDEIFQIGQLLKDIELQNNNSPLDNLFKQERTILDHMRQHSDHVKTITNQLKHSKIEKLLRDCDCNSQMELVRCSSLTSIDQGVQQKPSQSHLFIERMIQQYHKEFTQDSVLLMVSMNKRLIIQQFRIYYGKFGTDGNGYGKQYLRIIDEQYNSKFRIFEGQFQNHSLNGLGKKYIGKSQNILLEGHWNDGKYIRCHNENLVVFESQVRMDQWNIEIDMDIDEQNEIADEGEMQQLMWQYFKGLLKIKPEQLRIDEICRTLICQIHQQQVQLINIGQSKFTELRGICPQCITMSKFLISPIEAAQRIINLYQQRIKQLEESHNIYCKKFAELNKLIEHIKACFKNKLAWSTQFATVNKIVKSLLNHNLSENQRNEFKGFMKKLVANHYQNIKFTQELFEEEQLIIILETVKQKLNQNQDKNKLKLKEKPKLLQSKSQLTEPINLKEKLLSFKSCLFHARHIEMIQQDKKDYLCSSCSDIDLSIQRVETMLVEALVKETTQLRDTDKRFDCIFEEVRDMNNQLKEYYEKQIQQIIEKSQVYKIVQSFINSSLYTNRQLIEELAQHLFTAIPQQKVEVPLLIGLEQFQKNLNEANNFLKVTIQTKDVCIQFLNRQQIGMKESYSDKPQYQQSQTELIYWTKYDQVFSFKDIQVLCTVQWLTRNIIDAYITKLNIEDEQQFWRSINKRNYSRCFIFSSQIFTNYSCNKEYLQNIKDQLMEYEGIDYKIDQIFQVICFVVNIFDQHWILVRVDIQKQLIYFYDSLNFQQYYVYIKDEIVNLLNEIYNNIKLEIQVLTDIPKQKDEISCGKYLCIYAQYISQKKDKGKYTSLEDMTKILLELIENNQKQ